MDRFFSQCSGRGRKVVKTFKLEDVQAPVRRGINRGEYLHNRFLQIIFLKYLKRRNEASFLMMFEEVLKIRQD